ncbi:MAG TPA: hypothetical protein VK620_14890, partial [Bradyrhizobium sp.]|nr:hypothetical protein [Bradyrhizobium sp.]
MSDAWNIPQGAAPWFPQPSDAEGIAQNYPALAPYTKNLAVQNGKSSGPSDDRVLEFYQPWESDNPNPGKLTSELFPAAQSMSPQDRQETIAGDMLHHLGAINPATGMPVDPNWYAMKQELGAARTPQHLKADANAYAQEKANPSYETAPYSDWDQGNRLDAYVRAGVFPNQNKEWGDFIDNPKMRDIHARMQRYLTTGTQ